MQMIREIKETDVKALANLEKNIFSDAWSEQGIRDTLAQPQAFVVVAEQDRKIAGYCIVYYVLDEAEIARIAVEPSCRRQGIGQKILDFTKVLCIQKNVSRLLLDVRESNQTARCFYEKYGFGVDGIRKNFYDNPKENAVLMSMTLPVNEGNSSH